MIDMNLTLLIIILNLNGLSILIKGQEGQFGLKKKQNRQTRPNCMLEIQEMLFKYKYTNRLNIKR